jgi:U3 small nucleolar RNA-associated protein 19
MARKKAASKPRALSTSSAQVEEDGVDQLEAHVSQGGAGLKSLLKLSERSKLDWKVESERIAARHALRRCFGTLLERGELKPTKDAGEAEESARKWLEDLYESHLDDLVGWMWNDASTSQERVAAVRTLLWFAAREHFRQNTDLAEEEPTGKAFNFDAIISLVETGLSKPLTAQDLVLRTLREEYIQLYIDFQLHYMKALQAVFNTYRKTKRESQEPFSIETAFLFLCLAPLPKLKPLGEEEPVQMMVEDNPAMETKLRKVGPLRKAFQNAWLAFLRLRTLQGPTFKTVLRKLPQVLPFMSQPLLLSDFLTESFSAPVTSVEDEDEVPLLAVSALFTLVRDYGLDYPGFYDRLYELVRPSLFFSDKRESFCLLLDAALKSSHIPAYMVAAFCKKLARVALLSNPSAAMFALAEVYNLLRRHPSCVYLIHRIDEKGASKGQRLHRDKSEEAARQLTEIKEASRRLAMGLNPVASGKKGQGDPFDYSERDPAKCKANESSLWEVESLKYHYCPSVASLAKSIFAHDLAKDRLTKPELPLQDFILGYYELYAQEARLRKGQSEEGGKRLKVDAPLNIKRPEIDSLSSLGLFADD